jgi:hypothetical protein
MLNRELECLASLMLEFWRIPLNVLIVSLSRVIIKELSKKVIVLALAVSHNGSTNSRSPYGVSETMLQRSSSKAKEDDEVEAL